MQQKQYRIRKRYRFLVNFILFFFNKIFKIKGKLSPEVQQLSGPYLLLANHIGTYDPFFISYFLTSPPHFVSSDAVFRDRILGFFLKRLGVIPKKKNVRDTQVIRDMMAVAKNGGAIGLFPEGSRSWTGTGLHIEPSIAKLIKLLDLPVVTAKMKGMHLTNPRWGFKLRRSAIEIEYQLSFPKAEISALSTDEILTKIRTDLFHDEVNYQRIQKSKIKSKHRAEYISYVLFYCPSCKSIGQIESGGNHFECKNCGQKNFVNDLSFFESIEGGKIPFDNIRDWFSWQREAFEKFIKSHFRKKTYAPLFTDENMEVYKELNNKMEHIGTATMTFYINRILLKFNTGHQMEFRIEKIQALNPQLRERIEIFYNNQAYRITCKKPGISGLKWEIATNAIWQLTEQQFKQSTYLAK